MAGLRVGHVLLALRVPCVNKPAIVAGSSAVPATIAGPLVLIRFRWSCPSCSESGCFMLDRRHLRIEGGCILRTLEDGWTIGTLLPVPNADDGNEVDM